MPTSRATIERRQLGAELRRLRNEAGKSQREAGEVLESDSSLISRAERGLRALKQMELGALLDFYGSPNGSREQVAELAKMARQRLPRRTYSDNLPGSFRRLADQEQDAAELYDWDSTLVSGLLQTEEYIRAVMRVGREAVFDVGPEDIEDRVQFRLERQELISCADPPRMWFIMDEAALRRPVGHWNVLVNQLRHLLGILDSHSHILIQVTPLSIVDHPLLSGSLEILRFGGVAPNIVYQRNFIGGGVYLTDDEDIARCERAFDRLRALALGPEESRDFIAARLEEFSHDQASPR